MSVFCSGMTVGLLITGIMQRRVLWGLGWARFIGGLTDLQIEIPCIDVTAFRTS